MTDAVVSKMESMPGGFAWDAVRAGIKASGNPDVAVAVAAGGAVASAMYTSNLVVAAPVLVGRRHLLSTGNRVGAVLVNAGNANCATGQPGIDGCISTCVAAAAVAGVVALTVHASGDTNEEVAPVFGVKIPPGYRDWRLISVAHEEGHLNDFRAVLGNEAAIKAYREGVQPFPDGTIIARLAWSYGPSEENNRAFGRVQSYVAGSAINVQFMVKDSRKYAATGGWGFAQFKDGKPADEATHKTCFPCHQSVKPRDFVFTHYAP